MHRKQTILVFAGIYIYFTVGRVRRVHIYIKTADWLEWRWDFLILNVLWIEICVLWWVECLHKVPFQRSCRSRWIKSCSHAEDSNYYHKDEKIDSDWGIFRIRSHSIKIMFTLWDFIINWINFVDLSRYWVIPCVIDLRMRILHLVPAAMTLTHDKFEPLNFFFQSGGIQFLLLSRLLGCLSIFEFLLVMLVLFTGFFLLLMLWLSALIRVELNSVQFFLSDLDVSFYSSHSLWGRFVSFQGLWFSHDDYEFIIILCYTFQFFLRIYYSRSQYFTRNVQIVRQNRTDSQLKKF